MKIVFMGTPGFAVPCLDQLIKNFGVEAVFTQPDRPKGRGKKLAMSAVKERALEDNIPVIQPEKIKKSDAADYLRALQPDVIVVVAYGQLLSQELLDIPKYGCINVHASLLPKYRGAAPINFAILNGETVTGVTTMYMVKQLDAGDMIDKAEVAITEDMTAGQLHDLLSVAGGDLIVKTINDLKNGVVNRTAQVEADMTYAPLMDKEMAVIDWTKPAQDIHNQIRAFNPWPTATSTLDKMKMKVFTSTVVTKDHATPGQVLEVSNEGILVACGQDSLLIKEIQLPNKKRMAVSQYILGNDIKIGTILGE